jgi:hypothetical protein
VKGLSEGQRRAARQLQINSAGQIIGVLRSLKAGGPIRLGMSSTIHSAEQAVRRGQSATCPAYLNLVIPVRGVSHKYDRPGKRRLNKTCKTGANRVFKLVKGTMAERSHRHVNAERLFCRVAKWHARLVAAGQQVAAIHPYQSLCQEAVLHYGLRRRIELMEQIQITNGRRSHHE